MLYARRRLIRALDVFLSASQELMIAFAALETFDGHLYRNKLIGWSRI